MNAPTRRLGAIATVLVVAVAALAPLWLPRLGTALAVDEPLAPSDVALVLEGTGTDAMQAAENWRLTGLVHDVVIVEAPIKTHALVAYWTDFVAWGIAAPSPTPADRLHIVRSPSTLSSEQGKAALPVLLELNARAVLVPGGGGIGTRLVERDLRSILNPIEVRLVRYAARPRDLATWYTNAEDRRAVLDSWLQLLVPYLSSYEPLPGT